MGGHNPAAPAREQRPDMEIALARERTAADIDERNPSGREANVAPSATTASPKVRPKGKGVRSGRPPAAATVTPPRKTRRASATAVSSTAW